MGKEVWNKPCRRERKEILRREAEQRKVESDKLTPTQRLARLDKKFGFGKGARKERARLEKLRASE